MHSYFNEIDNIINDLEVCSRVRHLHDNSDKLNAYWNIGKLIAEAQGRQRAKYGNNLLKLWGEMFSQKYGKLYGKRNLIYMRQFYLEFPIVQSVIAQLTWTHILKILPIKNENECNYYINQTIINHLSVRELDKEIKSKSFDRLSYADKENTKLLLILKHIRLIYFF